MRNVEQALAAQDYQRISAYRTFGEQWSADVELVCDVVKLQPELAPLYENTNLPFEEDAVKPQFRLCAKHPHIDQTGYVLYYTSQCPFNAKYVPVVEQTAKEHGIAFKAIHIERKEDAQNAPTPITTYALFYNGEYLTNEQMNEAKFLKLSAR